MAIDTRPLGELAFRRTFFGQAAAVVGTMVSQVAVPVQVYSITHSSFDVGLVGFAGLAPVIVFGLYGGTLADHVDRRTLYRGSSLLTWFCTLGLLVQSLTGVQSVPLILALVAVQSAGFALSSTVRGAIVPALVDVHLVPAANALFFTAGNVGQVVGPLLAGAVLLLPHGYAYAYSIDAVMFTAVLYAALRLPAIPRSVRPSQAGIRAVVDGLGFIMAKPILLVSFLIDLVAMVFAMPEVLFPQVADERFNGGVGVLYAAIAVGSILMGLNSGWIGRVRRQGVLLGLAAAVWAAAIAVAGLMPTLWATAILLTIAGGADLVSAVCRQTILQAFTPDHMRGRLQGVYVVIVAGGPRLGDLRAGAMAPLLTITLAWSGSAAIAAVAIVGISVLVRSFWQFSTSPRPQEVH